MICLMEFLLDYRPVGCTRRTCIGFFRLTFLNHRLAVGLAMKLERTEKTDKYPKIGREGQSGAFFCYLFYFTEVVND